MTQIGVSNGTMRAAVLDLARHKVIFEGDTAPAFDWAGLRGALAEADPNVIDVHSLENQKQDAHFFVTQVSRRIESASPGDAAHVIIVLMETHDEREVIANTLFSIEPEYIARVWRSQRN